ncbi:MAG: metal-sensing transcriptional repressor [Clostridia bacterium]|nr:metal-sensing transcriptional repressor [Clostridia bacterium]
MECDKKCSCCEKTTIRNDEEKKKLINRLSRIEGQVRGLKTMVEDDAYCADILIQSAAINAAINSFNKDLLERHIHTCVARDIKAGDENAVDELAKLVLKLMK